MSCLQPYLSSVTEFVNESYAHFQELKAKEEAEKAQMKSSETKEKEDVKDV